MHADEVDTDAALVRRLLLGQFPQWADLPIEAVPSAGTDHALYRLGDEMSVRLPRIHWAVGQASKEARWLPKLAPRLPLAIPAPIAQGQPAEGYPWDWSVYRWLPGENAIRARIDDLTQVATDLAAFIGALRQIDTQGGRPTGAPSDAAPLSSRGNPLAERDAETRAAIADLDSIGHLIDARAVIEAWEASLRAPVHDGPLVWIHGDLMPGNLLIEQGRLSAVIDFGCLGLGDPACDLMIAWTLFAGASRAAFRAALGVDDASWLRGRGWALSVALIALPYYLHTYPVIVEASRHAIAEVLADHAVPR
jgi:aminoglycoside phosphotransferase (APT) family kinase protein